MADESVIIPIELTVTDIRTGDVNLKDVQKTVESKLRGIAKSASDVLGNVDTSKMNKALTNSMDKVTSSYSKLAQERAKLNDAMASAGSTSPAYKKDLKAIQEEIDKTERMWQQFSEQAFSTGELQGLLDKRAAGEILPSGGKDKILAYEQELARYEAKMKELQSNIPDPRNYVSTATTTELQKIVSAYYNINTAINKVQSATDNWNNTLADNKMSDEYIELRQEIQKAEQQMAKLQAKAEKMNAVGATDKQWEGLVFDANKLSKAITYNEAKMRKLVKSGKAFRFGNGGKAIGQEYMKLTGILSRAQKAMNNINSMKPNTMYTAEYSKQLKELGLLERKLMTYQDKFTKMQSIGATNHQWKALQADMDILGGKIQEVTEKLVDMVNTGQAFKLGTGDVTAELTALQDRINGTANTFINMENAPKNVKVNVNAVTNAIIKFCNSAKKGLANVVSMFKKLGKTSNSSSKDVSKSLKKMAKNLIEFIIGARSLYMVVNRIRTTFIKSFQEMAAQIPEVNASVSSFMTQLNQLKGSIATAFQPIAMVVIPYLNQLIAALSSAMHTLGMFFATLTGQGYIYKFTAAQVDYAESLDKTGSAAKEAQKSLMGFDEINRLNGDTGGGGGGSSSDVPIGSWEQEMLNGTNKLAELIKQAWSEKDFTEVGKYIGEGLLRALQNANNWILSKGFTVAEGIGQSIATLINGTIDVDGLGWQIGETFANALNMAIAGINKFLTTTNWKGVGEFIASSINGAITTFNWDSLGKTLANVIKAGIDTMWKFIGDLDFSSFASGVSTSINNLFSSLLVDDENGLNSAEKFGQSLSGLVQGIVQSLTNIINETDWTVVGQVIGTALANIDWSGIMIDIAGLISAIITAVGNLFSSWSDTDPVSAGIATMLAIAIGGINLAPIIANIVTFSSKLSGAFSVIGTKIGPVLAKIGPKITGVFSKLGPIFTKIGGVISKVGPLMVNIFTKLGGVISKVVSAFNSFGGGIALVISGAGMAIGNFIDMLTDGFSWVKEILMVIGVAIATVGVIILAPIEGVGIAIAAIVGVIVAAVMTIVVFIKDNWQAVCDFFVNLWNNVSAFFVNVWNGLVTFIKAILSAIAVLWNSVWTNIKTFFVNLWNSIVSIVTTVFNTIKGIITTVINAISTVWSAVWNAIKTTVSNIWNGIKSVVSTAINAVKTGISNALNNIKTAWSNGWNTMKSVVSNVWNGIWSVIKGVINTIIGGINGMIQGIVNGVNAVIKVINGLSFDVPDWVPGIGGSKFSFNLSTMTAPSIPLLAKGAVIPPNKEFMAILGDQKHGTNIEAPLDTIKQAVAEELAEYIDAMMVGFEAVVSAINDKDMSVSIGDSVIGKAAERYNKRQNLARGTL